MAGTGRDLRRRVPSPPTPSPPPAMDEKSPGRQAPGLSLAGGGGNRMISRRAAILTCGRRRSSCASAFCKIVSWFAPSRPGPPFRNRACNGFGPRTSQPLRAGRGCARLYANGLLRPRGRGHPPHGRVLVSAMRIGAPSHFPSGTAAASLYKGPRACLLARWLRAGRR